MSPAISAFCALYRQLGADNLHLLSSVYRQDVRFCDPAHELQGIIALSAYFEGLFTQVSHCRFDIEQVMEQDGEAYVRWQMHFGHPRLGGGSDIAVPGVSHLRFDQHIYFHRDYFDLGAMLYEQLPLLGGVVRALKRRLAS
ncbi:nuclear transport factor 2 family protein [Zobellella maritima]|uniref:nuclear transport factor 2 family protein n=1 Tax=Zobellella maritima TaxID=2059725 RepID=UPI000E3022E5|nr:nuclear transport factor 2 family protein [Zobellella maritima]